MNGFQHTSYVVLLFSYTLPDIRWALFHRDNPGLAGCKKPHRFPIHEPYFVQIDRYLRSSFFSLQHGLQLRQLILVESTAQSEHDKFFVGGSQDLEHFCPLVVAIGGPWPNYCNCGSYEKSKITN